MNNIPVHKAQIPNPALKPFNVLIGEWETVGSHPIFPGTILHGYSSFKWIEGGAFLMWYSTVQKEGFPTGIAIIGSDDAEGAFFMLYFDERGVSRKHEVSFKDNVLNWWRNTSGFSQRYSWAISNDGNTIVGKGELSKDGITWQKDLDQTFTRIK
ncbi:MAG: hypothetical protein IT280_07765 [Ignavibacteria bacterium]|nr:hypothetical protein [Ignavibacteria bacterium]